MGLIVSTSNRLLANDIYITQSGTALTMNIDQIGTNNTLNVDQEGTAGNTVTHVSFWGPMYSYGGDINGNNNNVKIKQTITTGTDTNRVGFHIMSNDNNVDICQGGTFSSSTDTSCSDSGLPEYGGHTINLDLHSGNNDLRMGQETTQYSNSNQSYSLTNTCMTVGGCSVSATQN